MKISQKIFYSALLALASCYPSEEEKIKILNDANADKEVIDNISKYDDLRSFLENNIISIFEYRNSKNFVVNIGENGPIDTVQENEDCYLFFNGNNPTYNLTNVPNDIQPKLETLWKKIGDENIVLLDLCKDKSIRIVVKNIEIDGVDLSHQLLSNISKNRSYSTEYEKDSLIGVNWIYRIGIFDQSGH